jgi:hypothetical protein
LNSANVATRAGVLPKWLILNFDYSELLVVVSAIISTLFIVASVGNIRIAARKIDSKSKYSGFIGIVSDIGFVGLVVVMLPAMVLPISFYGSLIVFIIVIVAIVLTLVLVNF